MWKLVKNNRDNSAIKLPISNYNIMCTFTPIPEKIEIEYFFHNQETGRTILDPFESNIVFLILEWERNKSLYKHFAFTAKRDNINSYRLCEDCNTTHPCSSILLVREECSAIFAVWHNIRHHPLVSILSSLSGHAREAAHDTKVNLITQEINIII